MTLKKTDEQLSIIDLMVAGIRSLLIRALAGTGKSTLIRWLIVAVAERYPEITQAVFCFNKNVADDMARKVTGSRATVATANAFGYRQLRKGMPDLSLPYKRQRQWFAELWDEYPHTDYRPQQAWLDQQGIEAGQWAGKCKAARQFVQRALDVTRLTLTDHEDPSAIYQMVIDRGMEPDTVIDTIALCQQVSNMLVRHLESVQRLKLIDFTDQIWLPIKFNLPIDQFDLVYIDEAQDTDAAKRELYSRAVAPGGNVVPVGDEHQAIYFWAGADNDAMDQLVERFGCEELPLTFNWRCAKRIIFEAQLHVPGIKHAPTAIDGTVADVSLEWFLDNTSDGDLVMARVNAPLVKYCMALIKAGKKANVKGREIGEQLCDLIDTLINAAGNFDEALEDYRLKESARVKGSQAALEALEDKCNIIEHMRRTSLSPTQCKDKLKAIFDNRCPGIELSSIHKQKGCEAKRVFLLNDHLVLKREIKSAEQAQQEDNLLYVAKTRAMEEMYFVSEEAVEDFSERRYDDCSEPLDKVTALSPKNDDPALAFFKANDNPFG